MLPSTSVHERQDHPGLRGRALHLDLAEQPFDPFRVDQAGPEVLGGLGAAGDAVGEALLGDVPLVAGGDEARQERVARADGGARLDRAAAHAHAVQRAAAPGSSGAHQRVAAVGHGHDRLARAELAHLAHRDRVVLVVVELVADELLGLEHVRRDHVGLGAHGAAQRVAVGVDHA